MKQFVFVLLACATTIVLVSCGTPPAAPVPSTATSPAVAPAPAKLEPTTPPTTVPSPTPAPPTAVPPTATSVPTNTAPPPTSTPQPIPTATVAPTNTPVPSASVNTATLNVRSGPGNAYDIISSARQGEGLAVTGQANDCAWLKIKTAKGEEGWVIGGADYVTLNFACATVPAAAVPPMPTPAPPTATQPPPPPTAAPTASGAALPEDKGCYLFISYVGDELTTTLTRQDGPRFNQTFKLAPMGQYLICLDPGQYTYTLDHPKWTGGGQLTVEAGKHYRFPIVGQP